MLPHGRVVPQGNHRERLAEMAYFGVQVDRRLVQHRAADDVLARGRMDRVEAHWRPVQPLQAEICPGEVVVARQAVASVVVEAQPSRLPHPLLRLPGLTSRQA